MVDKQVKPQACWEFDAEVLVLHHPTTISTKYQAMGGYQCSSVIDSRDYEETSTSE